MNILRASAINVNKMLYILMNEPQCKFKFKYIQNIQTEIIWGTAVVSHITYLSEQTKLSLISHDVCIILTPKRLREIKRE